MSSLRLGRPTGRNITGGLPPSPRARSVGRYDVREKVAEEVYRDRTRDSDHYPYRRLPAPVRSVRPQRSTGTMSPSRGGPSTHTDVSEVPPLPPQSSKSSGSRSGTYSSAPVPPSTFLDRMKGRGGNEYGYDSLRTNIEQEPESRKELRPGRGVWLRQRTAAMPEPEYGETMDGDGSLPGGQPGYGLSLWSRVATAASTLTISVSKAWSSNLAAYSGERTPPGEESRLTRALKAYHIEKARDPTDLPAWLFEEHERHPLGRSGSSFWYQEGSEQGGYDSRRATAPPHVSSRGLRDVYDAAATTTAIPSRQDTRESSRGRLQDGVPVGPPSKANDRLKALRDAKRNAAQRNVSSSSARLFDPTDDEWPVRGERGRGYEQERGHGEGPHHRSPRAPHGGGLPIRPGIRKI